jgi:rhodanese-related sulfurtransferase
VSQAKGLALVGAALGVLAVIGGGSYVLSRPLSQSPACKPDSPSVALPLFVRASEELDATDHASAIVFEPNCYRVGQRYPVQERFMITDGVWVYQTSDVQVRVTGIEMIDRSPSLSSSLLSHLGFHDQRAFEEAVQWYPEGARLQVVDVAYVEGVRGCLDHDARIESPLFKEINWSSLKKEMVLIDVRSAAEFARSHAEGVLKDPYLKSKDSDFEMFSSFEHFAKTDQFYTAPLPRDRNAELVFVGTDSSDPRPLRALIMAYMEGWRNVFWLRGGEKDRKAIHSSS